MSDTTPSDPCCTDSGRRSPCKVEAVVSIDERGQLVLPKDLRTAAGISAGDKLALVSWREGGADEICCFTLIRADRLVDAVHGALGPLMGMTSE